MSERKKIVLSDDLKKQLRGIIPLSVSSRESYTPSYYTDEDELNESGEVIIEGKNVPVEIRPVFKLRPMTTDEVHSMRTLRTQEGKESEIFDIEISCIESASNCFEIIDDDIVEVDFSYDFVNRLPFAVQAQLIRKIRLISCLSYVEKVSFQ